MLKSLKMSDKTAKNHSFQAEVSKLLDLVANSLYSEREIFLRELISNSADACEKLRYQSLSKKNILGDDADFKINVRVSKKKKTIEIEDNGIGFSKLKNNIKDILNPYFTTKKNGTGLGLSIVNKIVNDHNGKIDFIPIQNGAKINIIFLK